MRDENIERAVEDYRLQSIGGAITTRKLRGAAKRARRGPAELLARLNAVLLEHELMHAREIAAVRIGRRRSDRERGHFRRACWLRENGPALAELSPDIVLEIDCSRELFHLFDKDLPKNPGVGFGFLHDYALRKGDDDALAHVSYYWAMGAALGGELRMASRLLGDVGRLATRPMLQTFARLNLAEIHLHQANDAEALELAATGPLADAPLESLRCSVLRRIARARGNIEGEIAAFQGIDRGLEHPQSYALVGVRLLLDVLHLGRVHEVEPILEQVRGVAFDLEDQPYKRSSFDAWLGAAVVELANQVSQGATVTATATDLVEKLETHLCAPRLVGPWPWCRVVIPGGARERRIRPKAQQPIPRKTTRRAKPAPGPANLPLVAQG